MRVFVDRKNPLFDRHLSWPVGMLLSGAIGLLCFFSSERTIDSEARARFAAHALTATHAMHARLKSYTDVLRTAASMFQTVNIDPRQFHEFVDHLALERNYPALATINYALFLRGDERVAFDRMAGPGPDGAPVPIRPFGQRAERLVLAIVEPVAVRSATVGVDMWFDDAIARLGGESRDTGEMASSGRPASAMSGPNRTALGMRVPIYRHGASLATVSERRAAFIGSIGIGFYVNKLALEVLKEIPLSGVRMTISDASLTGTNPRGSKLVLFDSAGSDGAAAPPRGRHMLSTTLPVAYLARTWNVTFHIASSAVYSRFDAWLPWLALASGFAVSRLSYALLRNLLSARRRAIRLARGMTHSLRVRQSQLQRSHQRLRELAAHADQIKEGERKRIAREIHDDLGQNLLVLRMEASALATRTHQRHPRFHSRVATTVAHIDTIIKSVRHIINDLRPNVLDLGLSAAVEWQVGEFRKRTGLDCKFDDRAGDAELDEYCATAFFRVLQESLSNIVRHAHATAVWIFLERGEHTLTMTIRDNGIGLGGDGRGRTGSFGLVGIEERMTLLGGRFSIGIAAEGGTIICVSVPLRAAASLSTPQAVPHTEAIQG